MDMEMLTRFFTWCTILDGALLVLWTIMFMLAPGFIYRMQSRLFPIPRETYNTVIYSFLGLFKIVFIVFNVVPLVALLIIG